MGVGKNHAGIGYDLYGNKNRENEKEGRLTHQGSTVQAWEELHSGSGRDTLLIGSQMKGWQVQVETGRNLRMESLQDRETYDSRNTGSGISASTGGGYVSGNGSFQKQILHSDYESVTEQAGFYAGDQGFQIQAGGNTHLKGAVIHSDAPAEKNRLETGTLSWEDVENRASYKADGQGVAFSATTRTGQEDRRKLNERGLYPEVVSTVKGRAESTTKAGISAGSIIIREGEKQVQPVKQLNRDTKNSLQKLATIFDKEKVQEKQELVNELSKVGNRAIHELAARKGWQEGSDEKILAHSIFGGLLSSLAGGKIATGSLAGGVEEYANGRILAAKGKAWVEKHPDLVQAISAAVGSAVGAVTGESSIGSNVSLGGTKWNSLEEYQMHNYKIELNAASEEKEKVNIEKEYQFIDEFQNALDENRETAESRGFDFIKQFSDSGDQDIIHVYALKTKNIENQKIRDIAAALGKCALPQTIYIINEHPYKLEKSGILMKSNIIASAFSIKIDVDNNRVSKGAYISGGFSENEKEVLKAFFVREIPAKIGEIPFIMAKFNNYGEKYISVKFGSKIGMAPLKVWEVMDTQRDLFEKYNGMELFKAEAITYTVPVGTAVGISSFNIPLLKDNKSKSIVLAVGGSVKW